MNNIIDLKAEVKKQKCEMGVACLCLKIGHKDDGCIYDSGPSSLLDVNALKGCMSNEQYKHYR